MKLSRSFDFFLSFFSHPTQQTVFISFNIFAFAFLNPLLLYQLGKRHVNELHYNEKKDLYTAVTISPFVVNDKK